MSNSVCVALCLEVNNSVCMALCIASYHCAVVYAWLYTLIITGEQQCMHGFKCLFLPLCVALQTLSDRWDPPLIQISTYFQTALRECMSSPCRNDGRCVDGDEGYQCFCRNGFTGKQGCYCVKLQA